ncbi:MAG TPA: hypothetical protein VGJ05_21840 [Fimbriiglobus sp.]|jgi:hypothetical protein
MPESKSDRSIAVVRPMGPDGVVVVRITAGKKSAFYAVKELPCEIDGRGFAMHRLGVSPLYHVRIGKPEDVSCECMGFLARGVCRHVLGLQALADAGLL